MARPPIRPILIAVLFMGSVLVRPASAAARDPGGVQALVRPASAAARDPGGVQVLVRPASAAARDPGGVQNLPESFARVEAALLDAAEDLVALRHDLHRHPEVAGQETRTAALVAQRARDLGLEVRTGVGGHGVIAVLRGARPGPVVALRADMDAMPNDDPDPVPYRSETPGVRHICGHDVHTTVAVAVATGLAAVRDELPGTIVFLFQPAEENGTGARAMLADGAMNDPRPGAIYALHTTPLPVGQIGSQPGVLLAGRDLAVVTLAGDGDLARAAAEVATLVHGLTTFNLEQAAQPLVEDFVFGFVFHSAPDTASGRWVVNGLMAATTDSLRTDARRRLEDGLRRIAVEGVTAGLEYRERVTAGVFNDPTLELAAQDPIRAVIGEEGLVPTRGVLPAFSEDFGFFLDEAPGVMFWLGVSNPERGTVGLPHSPDYVADDAAILVGARAMAAVLLDHVEASGDAGATGDGDTDGARRR